MLKYIMKRTVISNFDDKHILRRIRNDSFLYELVFELCKKYDVADNFIEKVMHN